MMTMMAMTPMMFDVVNLNASAKIFQCCTKTRDMFKVLIVENSLCLNTP